MSAGLAIINNSLVYVEVDKHNNNNILRCEKIQIDNSLKKSFAKLKNIKPVNLGIPGAIIKPVKFPSDMSVNDVKDALNLDFENYFQVKNSDMVFDVIKILTLAGKYIFMAAAYPRKKFFEILNLAEQAKIKVIGVEPLSMAVLRAVPEIDDGIFITVTNENIIASYNRKGFLYRKFNNDNDINETVRFIETGTNSKVNDVIKIDDDEKIFYFAQGLAAEPEINLIPPEYISEYKKNHSFNLERLTGILLSGIFLLFSAGAVGLAIMNINFLSDRNKILLETINVMSKQRDILLNENSELKKKCDEILKRVNFLQEDIPALEILNALEANAGAGISLTEANFSGNILNIEAHAPDNKIMSTMLEGLNQSGLFESIIISESQKISGGLIKFNIVLKIKNLFINLFN